MLNTIIHGDCLQVMKDIQDSSVDAIVSDPPYELGFMGKAWDSTGIANNVEMWKECLRVLKPGGYLLSFGGTRTYHRMACAIEDAGFEVRDMIEWVYGSGFPKSLNIGHKIKEYKGWGTALKPAHEPICMARKPLNEKNVAENVLKWGTGGINIDGSRVDYVSEKDKIEGQSARASERKGNNQVHTSGDRSDRSDITGRFPANLIHDNSEEVRECFPDARSAYKNIESAERNAGKNVKVGSFGGSISGRSFTDSGNASRFFKSIIYQAKASKKDRGEGNNHATVKPIALMEYLIKMVTREGGLVLDSFVGSGTTAVACINLKRNFIGIEKEKEYVDIARKRIDNLLY